MNEGVGNLEYILIICFVLLSAFFSGAEAALLSVQRVRIRHLAESKSSGALRVLKMVEKPEKSLPPILLGNNLVNTAVAAVFTSVMLNWLEDENSAVLFATVGVTVILLIFGETIPKTLAANRAERFSIIISLPMAAIAFLFLPATWLLQNLAALVAKILGVSRKDHLITEEEIKSAVSLGSEIGAVEQEEAHAIKRLLELGERHSSEVMTPRPEIVVIEKGATISEFLTVYGKNSHTRFPVTDSVKGDVIGLVSSKDVLRLIASGASMDTPATDRLISPFFVPETKRADRLLAEMQSGSHQMALIADEFGDFAGLVTLKRLVEGIVGSTTGDDEIPEDEIVTLGRDTFDVDAGMSIPDANDRIGLDLPFGDYQTIAGLVMERLGRVPSVSDQIVIDNLSIQVAQMKGLRVLRVLVTRTPAPSNQDD